MLIFCLVISPPGFQHQGSALALSSHSTYFIQKLKQLHTSVNSLGFISLKCYNLNKQIKKSKVPGCKGKWIAFPYPFK